MQKIILLLREIKEYLSKRKTVSYSQFGGLHIVKMSILPKLFYRMNVIQINIPEELIYESNEIFLIVILEKQTRRES